MVKDIPMRPSSQVRRANFTLNNPTAQERAWLTSLSNLATRRLLAIRYIVFQEEIAPTTETHHLQGYIEWMKLKRPLGRMMKAPGSPYHRFSWHRADFPRASIAYAKKKDSRLAGGQQGEYGDAAAARNQTISDVTDQLNSGVSLQKVIDEHSDIDFRYHKNMLGYFNRRVPPRTACKVICLIGPSGCGKSTYAKAAALGLGTVYEVPDKNHHNGRWDWKHYCSQTSIIINEFNDTFLDVTKFKKFFDTFDCQIENKGDNMLLKSNNIFLTMNTDIKNWYRKYRSKPEHRANVDAMERRITQFFKIYECRRNTNYDVDAADPYMIMTLRAHPLNSKGEPQFRFASLDTNAYMQIPQHINPGSIFDFARHARQTNEGQRERQAQPIPGRFGQSIPSNDDEIMDESD